nr:venom peptide [Acharia stimulea]
MKLAKVFWIIFVVFLVSSLPMAESKHRFKKFFKKVEKIGRHVRDGIAKAGPAVKVVGDAVAIAKG